MVNRKKPVVKENLTQTHSGGQKWFTVQITIHSSQMSVVYLYLMVSRCKNKFRTDVHIQINYKQGKFRVFTYSISGHTSTSCINLDTWLKEKSLMLSIIFFWEGVYS